MDQYAGIVGRIQFDPRHRDLNGQTVTDLVVLNNTKKVYITAWSKLTDIDVGDVVYVEGKLQVKSKSVNGAERTFYNLNAKHIEKLSHSSVKSTANRKVDNGLEDVDAF